MIEKFIAEATLHPSVLDLGAGHLDDLFLSKKLNAQAELFAIENFEPCVKELKTIGVKVFETNLEDDRLPFDDGTIDLVFVTRF